MRKVLTTHVVVEIKSFESAREDIAHLSLLLLLLIIGLKLVLDFPFLNRIIQVCEVSPIQLFIFLNFLFARQRLYGHVEKQITVVLTKVFFWHANLELKSTDMMLVR